MHGTPVSTPPQHGTTQSSVGEQIFVPHTKVVPVLVSAGPESIGTVPLLLPLLVLPVPVCVGSDVAFSVPRPLLPIGSLMPPDETSPGPPEQAKMIGPTTIVTITILCFII